MVKKYRLGSLSPKIANPGHPVLLFNPGARGEDVPSHQQRDTVGWYATLPILNVTVPIIIDSKHVTGYQPFNDLLVAADNIITQLGADAKLLKEYQNKRYDFADWLPNQKGGRFQTYVLENQTGSRGNVARLLHSNT